MYSDSSVLRSNYTRTQLFESTIPYVAPESYYLPPDCQFSEKSYQYVPILKSLKVLLSDDAVRNQFLNPQLHDNDLTLNDYRDGEIFRSNLLFNLFIVIRPTRDPFKVMKKTNNQHKEHPK